MIKALFFDIDGTLVSFKTHQIPVSTVAALQEAKARGVQIFIATGRPKVIITNLKELEKRNLIDGYITMNGAYCFTGDTVISKHAIKPESVDVITRYAKERGIPNIVVGEHDICICDKADIFEELFYRQLEVDVEMEEKTVEEATAEGKDIFQLTTFIDDRNCSLLCPTARWDDGILLLWTSLPKAAPNNRALTRLSTISASVWVKLWRLVMEAMTSQCCVMPL